MAHILRYHDEHIEPTVAVLQSAATAVCTAASASSHPSPATAQACNTQSGSYLSESACSRLVLAVVHERHSFSALDLAVLHWVGLHGQ